MQDTNPTEDLLQGDDLQEVTYRSLLKPGWFKFCLGFLIYVHFSEIYGIAQMRETLSVLSGDAYSITLFVYLVYIATSLATVTVCILFYTQSRFAVKAGIPILIIALLLGIVSVAGYFISNQGTTWRLIMGILNVVILAVTVVYSFRIRKQWAEAIVVR